MIIYMIHPMAVADELLTAAEAATNDRDEGRALMLCNLAERMVDMYEAGFNGWPCSGH